MATITKFWNRYFVALLVLDACVQIATFTTRPIMANYAVALGATIAIGGFIAGLNKMTALALRPVSGILSDRIPKKNSLILANCAYMVSMFGCALAADPLIMGIFAAVQGISLAFQSVSVISLTVLAVPPERTGSGVGLIGLVNTLALAVGPALGNYISEVWDYPTCFFAAGLLFAVSFVISILYKSPEQSSEDASGDDGAKALPETTEELQDVSEDLIDAAEELDEKAVSEQPATAVPEKTSVFGRLAKILNEAFYLPSMPYAFAAMLTTCTPSIMSVFVMTVTGMGYLENGALYFTAYALVAMMFRPLAGRLSDEHGILAIALPGLIIAAVGMMTLVFFHSTIAVIVAGVLIGAGQASAQCTIQAECVRGVDSDHLGRAANTYYFGADVAGGFGPVVGGVVLQLIGPPALFSFNALALLGGLVILVVVSRSRKRSRQEGE